MRGNDRLAVMKHEAFGSYTKDCFSAVMNTGVGEYEDVKHRKNHKSFKNDA